MSYQYTYDKLNLSKPLVQEYWEKKDARTKSVLEWLSTRETWVMDGREGLAGSIMALTEHLDKASAQDLQSAMLPLIRVMAYLSIPKAFRLIQWMEERYGKSGAPSKHTLDLVEELIEVAGEHRSAAYASREGLRGVEGGVESELMIHRLQTFKSVQLLHSIFHADRLAYVTSVLERSSPERSRR